MSPHSAARHASYARHETRQFGAGAPLSLASPPPAASFGVSGRGPGNQWSGAGQERGPRGWWQSEGSPHSSRARGKSSGRSQTTDLSALFSRGRARRSAASKGSARNPTPPRPRGPRPGGAQRRALGNPGSFASTGWTLSGFAPHRAVLPGDRPGPARAGPSWGPEA